MTTFKWDAEFGGPYSSWSMENFRSLPKTLNHMPDDAHALVVVTEPEGAELHESGYRCVTMAFFASNGRFLGRSAHGHDVLWMHPNPQPQRPGEESTCSGYEKIEMDWLPGSGLLRVWMGYQELSDRGLLLSAVMIHPRNKHGPDDGPHIPIHSDTLKDVKMRMREWMKHFGQNELRVAMDEVMGEM